jgi:predicted DNA-binding ribbon-helix-helix protein
MLNVIIRPMMENVPESAFLRGWVTDPKTDNTVLEVGNTNIAETRVLAFIALMPEIEEFLARASNESSLARLLLDKWLDKQCDLMAGLLPDKETEVSS